ncbi:unnamed protein product [Owenia fusiformis]|uniref:Sorting nexin-25 n=1 Tax=Owenia fusiformis TaxID=6347 RepID=A0A8S4NBE3_OWEFU|nr:unnamed protein product [Owenia fusiformis]
MGKVLYLAAALSVILSWSLYTGVTLALIRWSIYIIVPFIGAMLGFEMMLCSGKQYHPPPVEQAGTVAHALLTRIMRGRQQEKPPVPKVVISSNLDVAIQEVLDYILRDYVLTWYKDLSIDQHLLLTTMHEDIWQLLGNLRDRLVKVDMVKFMAQDAVEKMTEHLEKVKISAGKGPDGEKVKFRLLPWLASEEREIDFLRHVTETLLLTMLPPKYRENDSCRQLLRELIACSVLKPTVDMICDPDYINQKLVSYYEYREKLLTEHKRTYAYAASYEDFMKIIETCMDIDHLQQMRYSIIAEIMQATTINNLKRAQGIDLEKEISPKGTTKGDLLKARNLKRYINQLTVSKNNCEKRITMLGGPDYTDSSEKSGDADTVNIPGQKILSFSLIMNTEIARNHFMKYLQIDDNHSLLGFWIATGRLKSTGRKYQHKLASEIYQMYLVSQTSVVKLYLHRATIKGMEAFLIGNQGPEAFFTAQGEIYAILEEQHYHSFIVSDIYHQYMVARDADSWSLGSSDDLLEPRSPLSPDFEHIEQPANFIADQSFYAQQKLEKIDEKLMNKTQALQALKASQKSDPKILKLEEEIENEIEGLEANKRQLEFHIDRTEDWSENVGDWKASVFNTEVLSEQDKLRPYFVIIINTSEIELSKHSALDMPSHDTPSRKTHHADTPESRRSAEGWVISRTLEDFHALHEKLIQITPWLKKKELPVKSKIFSKSIDTSFLEKAKVLLNDYLEAILKDDRLSQSEAVYAFFSPSPEYLKQASEGIKRTRSIIPNIFRSMSQQSKENRDELLFFDEETSKDDQSKDSIAGPLYLFIGEVFQLKGVFKWLRRTLIMFVQVSFGRSINRQLRETVDWLFCESMLIYYIHLFRDSLWPQGQLAPALPERSDEEKLKTRLHAKDLCLENIPDALKNLVGEDNSVRGTVKIFEVFQDVRRNKQLFYVILELYLLELCPELRLHQQHANNPRLDSQASDYLNISTTQDDNINTIDPSKGSADSDQSKLLEPDEKSEQLLYNTKPVIPFYRF